ncbi:hypothetical protein [Xanthobacter variabilis]|uniref:hypothetical protein n=1 Tax=Xanthobacter variabilis TaxID=3119932 RepID=UPI0037276C83
MSGAYDTAAQARGVCEWLADAAGVEARQWVRTHPAFPAAMDESAASMVGLYSGNRLLNRVLNDRGRLLFGFLALYLHALPEARGGGLTVSHMAALAAETGVCSRGRAKAMLALLRWGGYLAPAEHGGDRRVKPLEPTPRMVSLQLQRWQIQYRLLSTLDPKLGELETALLDRAVFDAVAIALGDGFRAGYRVLDDAPSIAELADRDSGIMILMALHVAAVAGEASPSIAELARRFHVSRAHVLQLLKDAQAGGLLSRDAEAGAGRLTERGQEALADFFASSFAFLRGSAHLALERTAAAKAAAGIAG